MSSLKLVGGVLASFLMLFVNALFVNAEDERISFKHDPVRIEIETSLVSGELRQPKVIKVKAVGRTTYSVFNLENPSRIVIDLDGVESTRNAQFKLVEGAAIKSVRIGRQEKKTRIVLDMVAEKLPAYTVEATDDELLLKFAIAERKSLPESASATPTKVQPSFTEEREEKPEAQRKKEEPASKATRVEKEQENKEQEPAAEESAVTKEAEQNESPTDGLKATPIPVDVPLEIIKKKMELRFSLDRLYVNFSSAGRPVQNLIVKNTSEKTLYMTANVDVISNPGTASEKAEASRDLLVSPRRFSIEPGDQRTVRLVLAAARGSIEEVFRVNFIPQTDDFEKQAVDLELSGKTSRFEVVTGLALLAVAEPAKPQPDLTWQYTPDGVVLRNSGNVNLYIDNGQVCAVDEPERCAAIPVKRLYPGNSWRLKTPPKTTIELVRRAGDDYESVLIPPQ